MVTVRGRPTAVVLRAGDYDSLLASRPTLVDDLLDGPAWNEPFADVVEACTKIRSHGVAS